MAIVTRTPGVYQEEISLFPPSVAAVETAVPVFVGYTAKARDAKSGRELNMQAIEISSIAEYKERYGEGPDLNIQAIHLDNDNLVTNVDVESDYKMFDSLRMFYTNGGGKCFIVSVGGYNDTIAANELKLGLAAAALEDQITMLVVPDAVMLGDQIYGVQQAALKQCGELLDRFAIFDLLEHKGAVELDIDESSDEFRNEIGTSNLKYGAAYVPHLKVVLPKTVTYRNVRDKLRAQGQKVNPENLVPKDKNGTIDTSVGEVTKAIADVDTINTAMASYITSNRSSADLASAKAVFQAAYEKFRTDSGALQAGSATQGELNAASAAFTKLFDLTYLLVKETVDVHASPNAVNVLGLDSLRNLARQQIAQFLRDEIRRLNHMTVGADEPAGTPGTFERHYTQPQFAVTAAAAHWGNAYSGTLTPTAAETAAIYPESVAGLADEPKRRAQGRNQAHAAKQVLGIFEAVYRAALAIQTAAAQAERDTEAALLNAAPQLRNVMEKVALAETTIPPSGVMAGIYSRVDAARGVFKAPANESLNSVSDLTTVITHEAQGTLNVDSLAGKSINAIRPFLGRGKLVWGARTLDGNSNEWRYISVRRFFNMVEESCKNASARFVFEPNDKNTWVKVRGMIENFLLVQWRSGALQGAVPEDAFFVNVGLGETMTALDVLEGRMIVEIGMAVVRPAEFIILRFSHKMPVS